MRNSRGSPDEALASRPDVRAAELRVEAAAKKLGWERSRILALSAVLDANGSGSEGFEAGPGVEGSIPLFDRNQGGRARASADLEVASRQYVARPPPRRHGIARCHCAGRARTRLGRRLARYGAAAARRTSVGSGTLLQGRRSVVSLRARNESPPDRRANRDPRSGSGPRPGNRAYRARDRPPLLDFRKGGSVSAPPVS